MMILGLLVGLALGQLIGAARAADETGEEAQGIYNAMDQDLRGLGCTVELVPFS